MLGYNQKEKEILEAAAMIIEKRQAAKKDKTKRTIKRVHVSGLLAYIRTGIVTFTKVNKSVRVMHFEYNVNYDGVQDVHTRYLTVWDIEKGDYRKVNLETISEIETADTLYNVLY